MGSQLHEDPFQEQRSNCVSNYYFPLLSETHCFLKPQQGSSALSPSTYHEPGSRLGLYTYRSLESCSVLTKAIHQVSGTQDLNLGLSDLKPHAPDLFILEETEAPKS